MPNEIDDIITDKIIAGIKDAFDSRDKKRIKETIRGIELFAITMRWDIVFKRKDGNNDTRKKFLKDFKDMKKALRSKGLL